MDQKNDQHKSFTERVREHRLLSTFALLGTLSVGIVAGSVLTGTVHGAQQSQVDTRDATPLRIPPPVTETNQFATIAKEVGPAVVKINIEQLPKQSTAPRTQRRSRRGQGDAQGGQGDQGDMQDFFNHFFGGQGGQGQGGDDDDNAGGGEKRALGSGFIVDPRGYIITNNHVVDKADRIFVKLASDSETDLGHVGHVVGTDKDTDIAVVKIDSPTPLPTVKMGNSDAEQLGDWVLAIGSPFDLSQTVTAGIVSAKNRSISDGPVPNQFQKFIQTDAAINPGNSGGPLLNMHGEVIGVNTAIFTQSGGAAGVGFAVPSNTVIDVYNMLISPEHKVVRGSIGIQFQGGQSSAVGRVYGFAKGGVLIGAVTPGMPAAKAGLQAQDVITSIDGRPVKDGDDLVADISARRPGSTVRIGYLRGSKEESTTVGIANRADTIEANNSKGGDDADNNVEQPDQSANLGKLGITVQAVPANVLQQKKLQGGVLVTDVKPGSFAEEMTPFGLSKGDIIVEVNRKAVTDPQSFRGIINGLKSGDDVVFVVRPGQARDRTNSFVGGTLP